MVNYHLATSDRLEHALARLGAEFTLQVTGDWQMFESMLTAKPPGESHVMPEWAVAQARLASKTEHQQRAWLKGEYVDDDGAPVGGGTRRRRLSAKEKAKAKPDNKGKGGKDGGKGAPSSS